MNEAIVTKCRRTSGPPKRLVWIAIVKMSATIRSALPRLSWFPSYGNNAVVVVE